MFKRNQTEPFIVEEVMKKLPVLPEGQYWRGGERESWYYETSGIRREYSGPYYLGFGVTLCQRQSWWVFKWDETVVRYMGTVQKSEKDVIRAAHELLEQTSQPGFKREGEITRNTHENIHWVQRYLFVLLGVPIVGILTVAFFAGQTV